MRSGDTPAPLRPIPLIKPSCDFNTAEHAMGGGKVQKLGAAHTWTRNRPSPGALPEVAARDRGKGAGGEDEGGGRVQPQQLHPGIPGVGLDLVILVDGAAEAHIREARRAPAAPEASARPRDVQHSSTRKGSTGSDPPNQHWALRLPPSFFNRWPARRPLPPIVGD